MKDFCPILPIFFQSVFFHHFWRFFVWIFLWIISNFTEIGEWVFSNFSAIFVLIDVHISWWFFLFCLWTINIFTNFGDFFVDFFCDSLKISSNWWMGFLQFLCHFSINKFQFVCGIVWIFCVYNVATLQVLLPL